MPTVCLLGAGNVAWQLGKALQQIGYEILQIYSKTEENAYKLANELSVPFTTNINEISSLADFYIFALKDDVLADIIDKLHENNGIWLHTAGSIPIEIFKNKIIHYGVIYPLQTFNKTNNINWLQIPLFLEASDSFTLMQITQLAKSLSNKIFFIPSDQRKYVHLSAVFASNFTNFMYTIASDIIKQTGISFDVLLPLIDETCRKAQEMSPYDAQTGPAIRYDKNIINKQLSLLSDKSTKKIYKDISKAIHEYYSHK